MLCYSKLSPVSAAQIVNCGFLKRNLLAQFANSEYRPTKKYYWKKSDPSLSWESREIQHCSPPNQTKMAFSYSTIEKGALYSENYRMYFVDDCGLISPWHDIPLFTGSEKKGDRFMHMVVEIPRWSNAKMEMNLKQCMNPIVQDIKKGLPRFVNNIFPHHGYPWNYGAFPQTWENPDVADASTGAKGDNDPLDVCEIGSTVHPRGSVIQVKALGCLGLIDEGEMDWKIIAIDTNDPFADKMEDISDVEKHMPGMLKATLEWFKFYKVPTGKPANQFGFEGEFLAKSTTTQVINKCYEHWCELIQGVVVKDDISIGTTTCEVPSRLTREEVRAVVDALEPPSVAAIPDSVDRNCFIHIDQV